MNQSELIESFLYLRDRASAVGITLKAEAGSFSFADIPGATGVVMFDTICATENFVYGYEKAYAVHNQANQADQKHDAAKTT